ncbi:ATP-dependent Lon protease [Chloropicon primus]|uniref:ATP-dependent Lon protease n=1 Tax=Chloropicon primus TaxID=1764295 RepID=A0A5B8MEB4_9CHLO|nr:ATP-dependent Lon protease [Chloropicon primus]UPQ97810.1 ATP-dependent Lon protease [Chloropicon primus]|eukprot:QDZ18601.1 ATP-dependent Lon protease [Chloropicon primus]
MKSVPRGLAARSAHKWAEATASAVPQRLRPARTLSRGGGLVSSLSLHHNNLRLRLLSGKAGNRFEAPRAGAGDEARSTEQVLPIFPLSIVALPFSNVPLHIFEARYRVLFSTLLYGEEGIEEGLANSESEFAGSKTFGMCYVDKEGNISSVGGVLEIGEHKLLDDGRLYISTSCSKRFTVTTVVQEQPVLICNVEYLEDDLQVDEDPELQKLAGEVVDVFEKALALGMSLEGSELKEPPKPEQLTLPPTELSYWLASLFPQDPQEQQLMLQIDTTKERLMRLKEIFDATYNYHLARNSIKSALSDE